MFIKACCGPKEEAGEANVGDVVATMSAKEPPPPEPREQEQQAEPEPMEEALLEDEAPKQDQTVQELPKEEPPPPEEEPPEHYVEWTIRMQKSEGTKMGLTLDQLNPGHLVVKNILPGGLGEQWNSQNPGSMIKAGDSIVSVNGTQGMIGSLEVLKTQSDLQIKLCRKVQFVVKLDKATGPLGLKLSHGPKAEVVGVLPGGSIEVWNTKCPAGEFVVPGDSLLKVNGEMGQQKELLDTIGACQGVVELTFARVAA